MAAQRDGRRYDDEGPSNYHTKAKNNRKDLEASKRDQKETDAETIKEWPTIKVGN
jgi:hypothetical protein